MSKHDDEFWGDQNEWDSTAAPRRAATDRTGPINIVRKSWNQFLNSGSNATREHGIVRPQAALSATDSADDLFGDSDFSSEALSASPTRAISRDALRADMFDDLDTADDNFSYVDAPDEIVDGTYAVELGDASWDRDGGNAGRNIRGARVDPLIARIGASAVVLALLVPLALNLGGDDDMADRLSLADVAAPFGASSTGAAADAEAPAVTPAPGVAQTLSAEQTAPAEAAPATDAPDPIAAPAADTARAEAASAASAPSVDASAQLSTEQLSTGQLSAEQLSAEQSTGQDATVEASAAADTPAERVPRNCAVDYEVVAGDFWIRIADGAGVPLAELLEANGASASTPLYPGTSICLPAGSSTPPPPTTVTPTTTPATTTPPTTTPTTTPATTTPPTTTPPNTTPAAPNDVQEIIRNVWPDELEERAIEIAYRESRYVPTAQNFCCYGIFQIYWNVHQSWLDDLGITDSQQLFDPETNARAAYALYQRAGGWGPWGF